MGVHVELTSYENGKGRMNLKGEGDIQINCQDKELRKDGQQISSNLGDCLPQFISVSSIKYCSQQNQVQVSIQGPLGLSVGVTLGATECKSSPALEMDALG